MSVLDADVAVSRGSFRLEAKLSAGNGITIVFGPSGSGKTTLLHAVLGALRPERGRVALGARILFDAAGGVDAPVTARRIGIVFQDALLFPHMTARENVAFAAERAGGDPKRAAGAWLDRVGGARLADRRPSDLSGGERQRVALARALAAAPEALLLDEPFSALDGPSRAALGSLLVELQASSRIPFVHVTHDAGEALRMGTHLVMLDGGRVLQEGVPAEVVASPSSPAAARVVGAENLFAATVIADRVEDGFTEVDLGGTVVDAPLLRLPPGSRVALGLRAEDVIVATERVGGTSARNVLAGEVAAIASGDDTVELRVTTPVALRVTVTPAAARELALEPGRRVFLLIKANAFHRLDR